eukprot:TRINITY_DN6114_c0_g1_i10.p1 TRINITY_DN6114_c0_g1~~TRINITY_DN6114_c0_g1_i10.p1  ORF type:complete len:189 (-),score=69.99 TRINITY_DN6114_c0_g1_i10:461-1027(-)
MTSSSTTTTTTTTTPVTTTTSASLETPKKIIISSSLDCTIRFWDLSCRTFLMMIRCFRPVYDIQLVVSHHNFSDHVHESSENSRPEETPSLVNLVGQPHHPHQPTGEQIFSPPTIHKTLHAEEDQHFHVTDLLIAACSNTIKIWSLDSFDLLNTLSGHSNLVCSISVEDNLIVSGSLDHSVKLWVSEK